VWSRPDSLPLLPRAAQPGIFESARGLGEIEIVASAWSVRWRSAGRSGLRRLPV